MADEKIIFSVEFDDQAADEKMKALLKTSIELKQERQELDKAFKAGELSMQAYADKMTVNTKASEANAKATKDLKKDVELADAGRKLAAGSLDQMKAKAAELTKVYNSLSKEQRLNTVEGRKLGAQIKDLNEDIDKGKKAIGKGGFVDALKDAVIGNTKFGQSINTVGMAFKANPIGLVITAISTALSLLPKLFGKSGEGADFFSKKLDQVNAIVEVGFKRLNMLGEAVAAVFAGEWSKAAELAAGSVKDLDVAFGNAWDSAGALADQLDELEVSESNFTVTTAQTERAITQLLIQSKNRTLSEAERIKLLEKAEKLEKELNNNALKLAEERLAIEKANNKLKQEDSDEQLKRENDLQIKIEDLKTKSLLIEEKIQNRKDELADKAAEKAKKAAEEAIKALEAYEKLITEIRDELLSGFSTTAINSEIDAEIKAMAEKEKSAQDARNKMLKDGLDFAKQLDEEDAQKEQQRLQRIKFFADEEVRIQQAKVGAIAGLSGALSDIAGAFVENAKTAAGIQKGLALFQIGVDTAQAISSLTRNSEGNPANAFTGGIAGVVQFATGLARILANIAKAKQLLSAKQAFADGGLIQGKGGPREDNIPIWASSGEAVMNARAVKMFGPTLSAMNQAAGGKSFDLAGRYADGGLIARTVSAPVMQGLSTTQLTRAIASMPPPVLHLTELNKLSTQVNRTVAVSDH